MTVKWNGDVTDDQKRQLMETLREKYDGLDENSTFGDILQRVHPFTIEFVLED